ncbi:hypothetical protein [Brevibacterium sp. UCMA 11754]|uniref:hypothetical protein n=1 Tax=Brevibacterium sp. UCMA 11754 TaxID=2749198 RepID=UPI001F2BC329|nr:hypothetical protein [Brevibacterium sp. UCMA 11754]MCF2571093.1 hypothetical protein [Brevibacterium sp. UCMA 11754]
MNVNRDHHATEAVPWTQTVRRLIVTAGILLSYVALAGLVLAVFILAVSALFWLFE